jgi:hypothetical protein
MPDRFWLLAEKTPKTGAGSVEPARLKLGLTIRFAAYPRTSSAENCDRCVVAPFFLRALVSGRSPYGECGPAGSHRVSQPFGGLLVSHSLFYVGATQ